MQSERSMTIESLKESMLQRESSSVQSDREDGNFAANNTAPSTGSYE
jgi:hypothetical protein